MSLIERLGGYEATKEYLKKNSHFINFEGLERFYDELLEYRREHNIFEVGDWFVSDTILKPFKIIERDGDYLKLWSKEHTMEFSGNAETIIAIFRNPRHATDAEIKAGRRL